jgi:hypothetical protein
MPFTSLKDISLTRDILVNLKGFGQSDLAFSLAGRRPVWPFCRLHLPPLQENLFLRSIFSSQRPKISYEILNPYLSRKSSLS